MAPISPNLSPRSSSHSMSPQCSVTSLSWDGPLSSSSPFMHVSVAPTLISPPTSQTSNPSVAQTFSLSLDEEVIFLDYDGNISLDVLSDTLIYEPFHASEQKVSDNRVIEDKIDKYATQQVYSNPASSTRDCSIIQEVTES